MMLTSKKGMESIRKNIGLFIKTFVLLSYCNFKEIAIGFPFCFSPNGKGIWEGREVGVTAPEPVQGCLILIYIANVVQKP